MIPVLFQIGPIKVYSYGLMLGISFLLGSYILAVDFKRKKIDPAMASSITLIAVVFGVSGAKLLHLIEEWDAFVQDPLGMAFSAGGLTWYGGFILAMIAATVYIRKKKVPLMRVWDSLGLALILAYGVGRIGCHLSGDGDYGAPTSLPWGTIYAQGTAKPSSMLREYFRNNPQESEHWKYDSLRVILAGRDRLGSTYSRFDEVTPLHPTPIYEFLLGICGFAILWPLRTRLHPDGRIFMVYLMLASTFRFAVEYLRLNPRLFAGLSEAQLFSVTIFLIGLGGYWFLGRHQARDASAAGRQ